MVNSGSVDREFTVINNVGVSATNENTMNVQVLERSLNARIDGEMGINVGTVEERIQNAISTAIDFITTPRIGFN